MFACFSLYFSHTRYPTLTTSQKLFFGSVTTCISLSLRRTSAPIHLTSVLGVLGTQETSCILIAGLLERDTFDHFLPEFDKPWVIHLRENLLLFYKPLHLEAQQLSTRIEVRRHQAIFWRRFRGLKKKKLPHQPRASKYFLAPLPLIIIHTICISLSLR